MDVTKIKKVIIFNNKDSKDYWMEEPFREEYYRSEIESCHYLNLKEKEYEFKNDDFIDGFVNEFIAKHGKASGDITVFIEELRTFLKTRKKEQTENNRIG